MNHVTYCISPAQKRRHAPVQIFTSMEKREACIEEFGVENVPGGGDESV